jgi:hypothetical protein
LRHRQVFSAQPGEAFKVTVVRIWPDTKELASFLVSHIDSGGFDVAIAGDELSAEPDIWPGDKQQG